MERRAFLSLTLGAAALPLAALAKPLSCIAVEDHNAPDGGRLSSVPYNAAGVVTDRPDLYVETWQHRDGRILVVCRWPEVTEPEISRMVTEMFDSGYGDEGFIWQ